MKLQELKEWIESLPVEFPEYPVVFGHQNNRTIPFSK